MRSPCAGREALSHIVNDGLAIILLIKMDCDILNQITAPIYEYKFYHFSWTTILNKLNLEN